MTPSLWPAVLYACAIAVVNGFGRFAYGLLLPVMRADLGWDYVQSGWLNTANAVGYGVGALLGLVLSARWRASALFQAGLAATVVTLAACAYTRDLSWMLLWRLASGVGSAWVFACGGALVAERYAAHPALAGQGIAIYYAGGGLGIAASGLLLHPVLDARWSWPAGWLVLGLAGLAFALVPMGLAWQQGRAARSVASPGAASPATARGRGEPAPSSRRFMPIVVAYFLYGLGYIVYLTYVVAWLREMRLGVGPTVGLWLWLGVAVMASGWVWKAPMARWWPARTFAAATLCTALGTLLPVASSHPLVLLGSVSLVGGSFFMAPGAMMALARVTLPTAQWARAMSFFTFIFAIGQGLGPVAAGWLADTRGMNSAMLAGGVTLLLAAALALVQRPGSRA